MNTKIYRKKGKPIIHMTEKMVKFAQMLNLWFGE